MNYFPSSLFMFWVPARAGGPKAQQPASNNQQVIFYFYLLQYSRWDYSSQHLIFCSNWKIFMEYYVHLLTLLLTTGCFLTLISHNNLLWVGLWKMWTFYWCWNMFWNCCCMIWHCLHQQHSWLSNIKYSFHNDIYICCSHYCSYVQFSLHFENLELPVAEHPLLPLTSLFTNVGGRVFILTLVWDVGGADNLIHILTSS